jgi:hypothetical protein
MMLASAESGRPSDVPRSESAGDSEWKCQRQALKDSGGGIRFGRDCQAESGPGQAGTFDDYDSARRRRNESIYYAAGRSSSLSSRLVSLNGPGRALVKPSAGATSPSLVRLKPKLCWTRRRPGPRPPAVHRASAAGLLHLQVAQVIWVATDRAVAR